MAIAYYFVGFNIPEQLKLVFDGREKVHLATSKTNFKMVDVSEKFYDTPEEKIKVFMLSDDSFDVYVKLNFARQGYKFVKKENE